MSRAWVSLDELLPTQAAALRSLRPELDTVIASGARRHGAHVGEYVPVIMAPYYETKHKPSCCRATPNAALVPGLLQWAATLPFVEHGRLLIMASKTDRHRDSYCHTPRRPDEFIWGQLGQRRFYVEREVITSTLAYFDPMAWHGVEAVEDDAMSIRVDGTFTPEFRQTLRETWPWAGRVWAWAYPR